MLLIAVIKKALGSRDEPGLPCNNPEELLLSLANLCEDHMGGSSGVVSYHAPSTGDGVICMKMKTKYDLNQYNARKNQTDEVETRILIIAYDLAKTRLSELKVEAKE